TSKWSGCAAAASCAQARAKSAMRAAVQPASASAPRRRERLSLSQSKTSSSGALGASSRRAFAWRASSGSGWSQRSRRTAASASARGAAAPSFPPRPGGRGRFLGGSRDGGARLAGRRARVRSVRRARGLDGVVLRARGIERQAEGALGGRIGAQLFLGAQEDEAVGERELASVAGRLR